MFFFRKCYILQNHCVWVVSYLSFHPQLQSSQCVSQPAQLLPTTLAATREAPHISNNGAAARQHQQAQADLWLYAFARLFYSIHTTEIPLTESLGFNDKLQILRPQNQRSNNTIIFVESTFIEKLLSATKQWKYHKTCFSYIMSMNDNNNNNNPI